jgi:hypothetical protein
MGDEHDIWGAAKTAAEQDKPGARPFAEPAQPDAAPAMKVSDSRLASRPVEVSKAKSGRKKRKIIAAGKEAVVPAPFVPDLFPPEENEERKPKANANPTKKQLTPLQRAALGLSPDQLVDDVERRMDEAGGRSKRRSRWNSSLSAIQYVSKLSRDDDVRIRDSDRATGIFLGVSTALTFLSLIVPGLAPHRLAFVLVCDVLVGVMLALFVANRFGILSTLKPRQALLVWQLIMGGAFLGIFITINVAILIGAFVASLAMH